MPKIACTIAGSDSSGGAGIQTDLKTFAALGIYGASIITAVTAQNTLGVEDIEPLSTKNISMQMDAVFSDLKVDAVKIGMLFSQEIIEVVTQKLKEYKPRILVVDPVMVSTSGSVLLKEDAISSLMELFSMATLITPNRQEAEVLVSRSITTKKEIKQALDELSQYGASVLIKSVKPGVDFAKIDGKIYKISGKVLSQTNTHGTGCTLSSAICSYRALENDLLSAITMGRAFIQDAIEGGLAIGHGIGPTNPMARLWRKDV